MLKNNGPTGAGNTALGLTYNRERTAIMAGLAPTSQIRICEACGSKYSLNPKYSQAQKNRSRFCSMACAKKHQPSRKKPIESALKGQFRFGRLTFICEGDPIEGSGYPARTARFQCDCGQVRDVQPAKVRDGTVRSCGCLAAEIARKNFTKHGLYQSREYRSWNAMMQRCYNPKSSSFPAYGGRGISVHADWHGPDGVLKFCEFMGPRPEGMSLDRIEPNGNYEPGNVRWASKEIQNNNKRKTAYITVNGVTLSQAQWARRVGLSRNAVAERINRGWPPEIAATLPKGSQWP